MYRKLNRLIVFGFAILVTQPVWADDAPAAGGKSISTTGQPFVIVMVTIMVLLLLVIKSLASVLLTAARRTWSPKAAAGHSVACPSKPAENAPAAVTDASLQPVDINPDPAGPRTGPVAGVLLVGIVFAASMLSSSPARAEDTPPVSALSVPMIPGVSDTVFYSMISVIGLEVLVVLYLLFNLNSLLKEDTVKEATVVDAPKPQFDFNRWWSKINRFRPVTEEAVLDTGHDYDGIRELDNRLPPWWKYGFYCTIIFAVVYLWRYHVAHSAPLPAEEYAISVRKADEDKQAYLKKAANLVDENTVKLLTSPTDLDAGKAIFQSTCFACHGKNGEGGVGPNLTDAYWLHGGTIQEVFKTIKYGWPDKGMKSWKDDFSPSQIAQIASYVKSLAGTNPPNAKAPQGTLMK